MVSITKQDFEKQLLQAEYRPDRYYEQLVRQYYRCQAVEKVVLKNFEEMGEREAIRVILEKCAFQCEVYSWIDKSEYHPDKMTILMEGDDNDCAIVYNDWWGDLLSNFEEHQNLPWRPQEDVHINDMDDLIDYLSGMERAWILEMYIICTSGDFARCHTTMWQYHWKS